jgi:hypothetical protein
LEQPSPAAELHHPTPQLRVQAPTLPEQIRTSRFVQALDKCGTVPFDGSFQRLIERA